MRKIFHCLSGSFKFIILKIDSGETPLKILTIQSWLFLASEVRYCIFLRGYANAVESLEQDKTTFIFDFTGSGEGMM
jgi:hypothetical protein